MFAPIADDKYRIDVCSLNGDINMMHIDEHKDVISVSLIVRGSTIILTTPNRLGNVVFWKNWRFYNHYMDTTIVIEMNPDIIPKVQFRLIPIDEKRVFESVKNEFIFIPSQTNINSEFEGTPYNNVLCSKGDMLSLKYCS